MKKRLPFVLIILPAFFLPVLLHAQNFPEWTKDIVSSVDSANLFPVRVVNDLTFHAVVLTTYSKNDGLGGFDYKIYLDKYDEAGGSIWSLVFDNDGTGEPRGFDMVIDDERNIYIAGGLMETDLYEPFLMKVDSNGSVVWKHFSTTAFSTGYFDQLFIRNNLLYVKAQTGIAVFDLNGNEEWSLGDMSASRMAVDHLGRIILSASQSSSDNLFRYHADGTLDFSDNTTLVRRITVDNDNNFYLLNDLPTYELIRYDSSGNFSWSKNDFPEPPGFGDIGFEVITDDNNNVFVVGLSDTMFKFTAQGDFVWERSMDDLDSYIITAQIDLYNELIVAGSIPLGGAYDMKVAAFNDLGEENWSGYYNGNSIYTEFSADFDIDFSGVYVIENNNSKTTLVKFTNPFSATDVVDFDLICVDSVWYDPLDPAFINVTVFNGNISALNYPRVQIVAPNGDTISNVHDIFNFFGHPGNSYLTYRDTIIVPGITDFSDYTFLMNIVFPDTSVKISWCMATAIPSIISDGMRIYPNPVHDRLFIEGDLFNENLDATIYNAFGEKVFEEDLASGNKKTIDISELPNGVYFLFLNDGNHRMPFKFVKQ